MYNPADDQYLRIAEEILRRGDPRPTRNGIRHTIFGDFQMSFNLQEGFPLLTTKKMFLKGIIHELLWFLSGDTNIKYLNDNGVHIWDANADSDGDLGPIYGAQWRDWGGNDMKKGIDQIAQLMDGIIHRPYDTRHVLTAWNPSEIMDMQLPPCHMISQFDVDTHGRLSCKMFQRSADWFLGVPFNMASYALLTMMVADAAGLKYGTFTHTFANAHIYDNHVEQMKEQITRKPFAMPTMHIQNDDQGIDEFQYSDFTLIGYESHPAIHGEMSV